MHIQALSSVIFLARLKVSTLKTKEPNIFYSLKVFPYLEVMTAFIKWYILVISIRVQLQPLRVTSSY